MKVATIVGARPQFIKAAMLSRAMRSVSGIEEILIHTGQHYDLNMSDLFFAELDIPQPQFNLGIGSLPHAAQTGRMMEEIEKVLSRVHPEWVVIFGDTNSTLAGALAASKLGCKVAHVEAGLRCFDRQMPEELNRVVADHVSHLLFAPTESAADNLRREGVADALIEVPGDIMLDAARHFGCLAERVSTILQRERLHHKEYVLATVHRAENTDDVDRLQVLIAALSRISSEIAEVVLPLHPRTRKMLTEARLFSSVRTAVHTIEPVGFLDMIVLEKHARLIVTDSGGIQKEAYFHGVPCVTLRERTEWVELVSCGSNQLVPLVDPGAILRICREAMMEQMQYPDTLFGDGHSAEKMTASLVQRAELAARKTALVPA